jgi:peptide/nickel transport system substrate-binding protein
MVHIRWQALIAILGMIFLGMLLGYLAFNASTVTEPETGGTYLEGLAGHPNLINPLYSQYNDVDRDLVALIFSGMTRIDEKGQVQPDLAKKWETSADGLVYTFTLRSDVKWQDGKPLTADDVVYTLRQMQDPGFSGLSYLSDMWRTVAISQVNTTAILFQLTEPFAPFLDYTTIGLLPAHLLADVSADALPANSFNVKPVGTGPFQVEQLTNDRITLVANPYYYGPHPFLDRLTFNFYPDYESIFAAYQRGEIEGIARILPNDLDRARSLNTLNLYSARLSSYSLIFLNLSKPQFGDKQVRQALLYALDRQKIVDDILQGQGLVATSPILPGSWAYDPLIKTYPYDANKAKSLLDAAGWKDANGDGLREKDADQLAFTLTTNDDPTRVQIAKAIAQNWGAIGVKVDLKTVPTATIVQNVLRPRAFDAVLYSFGLLPNDPDSYALWNSTQTPDRSDAGLNYGGWDNRDADEALEAARKTNDQGQRAELYQKFQSLFAEELPALLLYYPVYTYGVDARVHDVQLAPLLEPSDRFRTLAQWYLKTRRVMMTEATKTP